MVLDMTQFLLQIKNQLHLVKWAKKKKIRMDHRFIAFKKLKNKIKIL